MLVSSNEYSRPRDAVFAVTVAMTVAVASAMAVARPWP